MEKTIEIPIKPYLKVYLEKIYGYRMLASHRSSLGQTLNPLLTYCPKSYVYKKPTGSFIEVGLVDISRSCNINVRGNVHLTTRNRRIFEGRMEEVFESNFLAFVNSYIDLQRISTPASKRIQLQDAINAFIDLYDPDNEVMNYEMLKKRYYRRSKMQ